MRVRGVVQALAVAVGLAAAAAATAFGAPQDDTARVQSNTAEYVFAESISFQLQALSARPIVDVTLRYTVGSDGPTNRRVPDWAPGPPIVASHHEDLTRGEIAPASLVTWWWTLTDSDGQVLDTPTESFRYFDQAFDWRSTTGDDVRVWWYEGDQAFAEGIAADARASIERLRPILGAPNRRIEVVVYASQDDMRPALAARGATYESRLATLGARVAPDILVLDAGTRSEDLAEVLAHELSHIVLHLRFANDYLGTASWLDEGLAMYNEGELSDDEQRALDDAITHDEIFSVRSLTSFPGEAELVPLAYDESRDIVAYLIDAFGEASFRKLISVVSAGDVTTDEALLAVYGMDQLALYQSYRAHYGLAPAVTPVPGSVVRRPRRRPPTGGPCPAALLLLPAALLTLGRRRHT